MRIFAQEFNLTDQQVKALSDAIQNAPVEIQGDGKATLLEPMTDEEFAKWEHEQDQGWKKVYDRLLRRS